MINSTLNIAHILSQLLNSSLNVDHILVQYMTVLDYNFVSVRWFNVVLNNIQLHLINIKHVQILVMVLKIKVPSRLLWTFSFFIIATFSISSLNLSTTILLSKSQPNNLWASTKKNRKSFEMKMFYPLGFFNNPDVWIFSSAFLIPRVHSRLDPLPPEPSLVWIPCWNFSLIKSSSHE